MNGFMLGKSNKPRKEHLILTVTRVVKIQGYFKLNTAKNSYSYNFGNGTLQSKGQSD